MGSSYLRVKRAHWLGDVAGEIRIFGENGGRPEFWNSVALFTQRQLIEAAKLKPLAAVGQDIAEANESKEKEPIIPVEITDDGRQISVDGSGRLTVPAAAAIKPAKSTGKILFMDSSLGGKQLHYNRNGAAEDFEYAFDAPAAGRYQLIAKVVTPSWRQSLQLRVNNSTASQEILLPFTVGTWGTTDPIEIELQAGRNQLQFSREGATAGVTIKEFTLTPIR